MNFPSRYLLGPSTQVAQPNRKTRVLITFMAGKMVRESRLLKPEPELRKGTVEVVFETDHATFYWKLRPSNSIIDRFILIPNEVQIRPVPVPDPNTYVFQIKQTDVNNFYWIQEPNTTQQTFTDLLERLRNIASSNTEQLQTLSGTSRLDSRLNTHYHHFISCFLLCF